MRTRLYNVLLSVVVCAAMTLSPVLDARAGVINVRAVDYGARGDDRTDDTEAFQLALDEADGDVVLVPHGHRTYRITRTLEWDASEAKQLRGEPGVTIRFEPPAELVAEHAARGELVPLFRIRASARVPEGKTPPTIIETVRLLGPRGAEMPAAPREATYRPGVVCGIDVRGVHRGEIRGVQIVGFNGPGMYMQDCFRWGVYSLHALYNDWGIRCRTVNATTFVALECMYNLYGAENPQSVLGGIFEGNFRDGLIVNEIGTRYSVHDGYWEQNGLANTVPFADISANPAPQWVDGTWKPVVLNLSGTTTFHNTYSVPGEDDRAVPGRNIEGCVLLSVNGAVRFFEPNRWHNFRLHPWSSVYDNGAGNTMIDIRGGFDAPVFYARPTPTKRSSP